MAEVQDVVVLLPSEDEQEPLDTGSPDDEELLDVPGVAAAPRSPGETLKIELELAGERVSLEVHPNAIGRLCVHRYSAGGWKAVYALRDAIFAGLHGSVAPIEFDTFGRPKRERSPQSGLAVSRAVAFYKKTTEAITLLEKLVGAVLVDIAADSLTVARDRIPAAKAVLEQDRERYGIKRVDMRGPTGGRPGTPPYRETPKVELTASKAAEAQALAAAVRRVAELHQKLLKARSELSPRGEGGDPEERGRWGPREWVAPAPRDPEGEERISKAEKAFLDFLGDPAGHRRAPIVWSFLRGKEEKVDFSALSQESADQLIWSKTQVYLQDTIDRMDSLVPYAKDYPFDALEERLGVPLKALGVALPEGAVDTPELRGAIWARQGSLARGYDPFDDEAVLVHLVRDALDEISGTSATPPLVRLVRYRALWELISARDVRDAIYLRSSAERQAVFGVADGVAGIFGLVGLLFPPAALVSRALTIPLLIGSALIDIQEMEEINQLDSARATGALLDSNEAAYAESLIARSVIVSVMAPLIGQVLGLELLGRFRRRWAAAFGVWADTMSIRSLPQNVEEWWVNE